jgi:hypothetical protein
VLVFVATVWAAFAVSRFLRFLLDEDIYYHWHLAQGVPQAISTIVHYAILLIGFFVGLAVLGVDLTKVTILAGAFTVGVGFGLQTVVNNFVCELILLFERPIKVGDIIQIDTDIGEVRRIGIRACAIRTRDGSEIIVPNGTIISNKVTNWTLSDRYRAIEVSVTVARGPAPQRVIEVSGWHRRGGRPHLQPVHHSPERLAGGGPVSGGPGCQSGTLVDGASDAQARNDVAGPLRPSGLGAVCGGDSEHLRARRGHLYRLHA